MSQTITTVVSQTEGTVLPVSAPTQVPLANLFHLLVLGPGVDRPFEDLYIGILFVLLLIQTCSGYLIRNTYLFSHIFETLHRSN